MLKYHVGYHDGARGGGGGASAGDSAAPRSRPATGVTAAPMWLRGRRCWRPADVTRTGAAAAGAAPGPGLTDPDPRAARIAHVET